MIKYYLFTARVNGDVGLIVKVNDKRYYLRALPHPYMTEEFKEDHSFKHVEPEIYLTEIRDIGWRDVEIEYYL